MALTCSENLHSEGFVCNTVVEGTSPSAMEGEDETAKRFYHKHHKSIKKVLPSQFPGRSKSFQEFLERIFPTDKEK